MTISHAGPSTVSVDNGRITVDHLVLRDALLAAFVRDTREELRGDLLERALRIGLLAIINASTTVSVDVVKAEFDRLVEGLAAKQGEAAETLERTLRDNFADKDGRLPRQLEAYLGDTGKLQILVRDLFDEDRRDSALGRLRELLGRYFDGDGSKLATLLDPSRRGSPLYQFQSEIKDEFRRLHERLEALDEAKKARAEERAKGTAKGIDFEDALEERLAELAHGMGDDLERTGTSGGDTGGKKGDFVIAIDRSLTRGADLRIVVEAKDRYIPVRRLCEEMADARENRGAAIAIGVFSPDHTPKDVPPLKVTEHDVLTTFDPESGDNIGLEAAYRSARILALLTLRDAAVQMNAEAVSRLLDDLRNQVDVISKLKTKLKLIGSSATEIEAALDVLRAGVQRGVKDLEAELSLCDTDDRPARPAQPAGSTIPDDAGERSSTTGSRGATASFG